MYTPEDLSRQEIIIGDRPYAGLAMLALSGVSNDFATGQRITTEYGIGVMGPAARQEQVQTEFHQWLVKQGSKKQWCLAAGITKFITTSHSTSARSTNESSFRR
jgi:hypothetical protein